MKSIYFLAFTILFFMSNNLFAFELPVSQAPQIEPLLETSVFNRVNDTEIVIPEDIKKWLIKDWYQVSISHNEDMFNPVFLPFNYSCDGGDKDSLQQLTFPCFLSFKFDFVPDNYSARHPGFVFRKESLSSLKPDNTQVIVDYIADWKATHAIGGSIVQTKDGYSGELLVFNDSGEQVLRQVYSKPVPYFTLMGQMVKTWMDHRGQPISDGLYQELFRPMTTDMECLRLYGRSFYETWRSQKEWDIYEEILKRDPDFAEVRFWYANQKGWTFKDGSDGKIQCMIERGKSLKSHLVISSLWEFSFNNCPDKTLVEDCTQILEYAAEICPDNPTVLSTLLDVKGDDFTIEMLDEMLPVAKKNPRCWHILKSLAVRYRKLGCYEKSVPLLLAAINSGFLKGINRYDWEWSMLCYDFYNLGYNTEAIYSGIQGVRYAGKSGTYFLYWNLGSALKDQFQFDYAARIFNLAYESKEKNSADAMSRLCVYQSGKLDLFETAKDEISEVTPYYQETARREMAEGLVDEALERLFRNVKESVVKQKGSNYDFENEIIISDACCLKGDYEQAKTHAFLAWQYMPQSRQVAYLLSESWNDSQALERYLKVGLFLHGDDPVWKQLADKHGVSSGMDKDESVIGQFNRIKDEFEKLVSDDDKWDYWVKFSPFEIEYVCMHMVQYGDPQARESAIELYKAYSESTSTIRSERKNCSRLFLLRLSEL